MVFLDRKQKRNTRNPRDSLLLQTPGKKKKMQNLQKQKYDQFFLEYYSRKLKINKTHLINAGELFKKTMKQNANKEN